MTEQKPFCGEPGQEQSFIRFNELPLGFQELGIACQEAGILEDFYSMIQEPNKYEFGDVYGAVVALLVRHKQMPKEVIEKALREDHGLYLYEDGPVGQDHRLW